MRLDLKRVFVGGGGGSQRRRSTLASGSPLPVSQPLLPGQQFIPISQLLQGDNGMRTTLIISSSYPVHPLLIILLPSSSSYPLHPLLIILFSSSSSPAHPSIALVQAPWGHEYLVGVERAWPTHSVLLVRCEKKGNW